MQIAIDSAAYDVTLRPDGSSWRVMVNGREYAADVQRAGGRWSLLISAASRPGQTRGGDVPDPVEDGLAGDAGRSFRSYDIAVDASARGTFIVYVKGHAFETSVPQLQRYGARGGGAAAADETAPRTIVAPMPGRVVKVLVTAGQAVEARQPLVIVEAMKMENELRAPRAGTVASVLVADGMPVEAGTVLVVVQ